MTTATETIKAVTTESAAARGMFVGMAIGFVLVGAIAVAITLNAGADLVPALGIGAFAGFWGGPGFGGMLGATLAATKADAAEREAARQG